MRLPKFKVILVNIIFWTCVAIATIISTTIVIYKAWEATQGPRILGEKDTTSGQTESNIITTKTTIGKSNTNPTSKVTKVEFTMSKCKSNSTLSKTMALFSWSLFSFLIHYFSL